MLGEGGHELDEDDEADEGGEDDAVVLEERD